MPEHVGGTHYTGIVPDDPDGLPSPLQTEHPVMSSFIAQFKIAGWHVQF